MKPFVLSAVAIGLAACASVEPQPDVVITELSAADIPSEILALAEATQPGFKALEAQKKVRDGRVYFDVEGETAEGEEIEFDILVTPDGPQVVEIQRDLDWAVVTASVKAAAEEAKPGFVPVRIIESKQTDGAIIYELFVEGQPADPAMEVRVLGEDVSVLTERWPH